MLLFAELVIESALKALHSYFFFSLPVPLQLSYKLKYPSRILSLLHKKSRSDEEIKFFIDHLLTPSAPATKIGTRRDESKKKTRRSDGIPVETGIVEPVRSRNATAGICARSLDSRSWSASRFPYFSVHFFVGKKRER